MKRIFFLLYVIFSITVVGQEPMTPVQIAERNKPGTVMIQATYKGMVNAIVPEINQAALSAMSQQVR